MRQASLRSIYDRAFGSCGCSDTARAKGLGDVFTDVAKEAAAPIERIAKVVDKLDITLKVILGASVVAALASLYTARNR